MSTPVGIIKKFVQALAASKNTGTTALNEAFKAVGATSSSAFLSKFRSAQSGLSYQDFLEQKCGVRINNDDTGAITGSDAGGKVTKTDESIMPETAAAKELTAAQYKSFTKNGLTVNVTYDELDEEELDDLGIASKFNYSSATYLAKQKLVTRALYNWWIPEALDLINQSLGINFTDGKANIKTINVKFDSELSDYDETIALDFSYDKGLASKVTLRIDPTVLYNMTKTDLNGKLPNKGSIYSDIYESEGYPIEFTNYLDRLILQAMAEVTLKANVAYVTKLPQIISIGLCAIVGGYDDASKSYGNFVPDDITDFYDYYVTTEGYTLLRYLAKNYSNGLPDGLSYNSAKTLITATTEFNEGAIDLADFASSVKSVNAASLTKGVSIIGNGLANSLRSGKGADTLYGGTGNDTLTGGSGNDLFIYSAGKDVITDYANGDIISLGAAVSKATVSGSNVVLTIGKGTLNIKNAKDKTLRLMTSDGKSISTIISGAKSLTLTDDDETKAAIPSDFEIADASARTQAITIVGNKLANTILGGTGNDLMTGGAGNDILNGNAGDDKLWGGAGADTLAGGNGNDTLSGGAGDDLFVYSAGKDVIADYAEGDMISIGAAISKSSVSGSDAIFTIGSSTLKVKNGKGKEITFLDANGDERTILGGTIGLALTDKSSAKITAAATYELLDASTRTKAIQITGNELDNTLLGGSGKDTLYGKDGNDYLVGSAGNDKLYGQSGNDTLWGGSGNDTLIGGDGADVFLYKSGEGKDVISGFANNDMLLITGDFSASYDKSTKTVAFDFYGGSITLQDFTASSFNVNGFKYRIKGTKLVKK